MTQATGIAKQLRYKKESTWGAAPGASGAQLLRRMTSNLALVKDAYQSNEIRSDFQRADFRHGTRRVEGDLNGELSAGTYKDLFAAVCRQAFQTAASTGAQTNITATVAAPQFVRGAGSFLTDGFKIGDVVRWTGWASPATANNTRNFLITALTATQMTGVFLDGTAVAAKAAGDSVTGTVAGKKTWAPASGHTDDSFAIEHWHSDVSQSELFLGCKIQQMTFNLPATGMATLATRVMGKDITAAGSAYYTSPTAETATGVMAAVNGALYVAGTKIAFVTGGALTINGNMSAEPVVGSNVYPDIFEGRIIVNGQLTAFFEDGTLRDNFINEDEISLILALTANNQAAADFISIVLPRLKLGSANKDDGEKGLVQTLSFEALYNSSGGTGVSSEKTTISIQDSQAT